MSSECLYVVTKYSTKLCSLCNGNFEALLFFKVIIHLIA